MLIVIMRRHVEKIQAICIGNGFSTQGPFLSEVRLISLISIVSRCPRWERVVWGESFAIVRRRRTGWICRQDTTPPSQTRDFEGWMNRNSEFMFLVVTICLSRSILHSYVCERTEQGSAFLNKSFARESAHSLIQYLLTFCHDKLRDWLRESH